MFKTIAALLTVGNPSPSGPAPRPPTPEEEITINEPANQIEDSGQEADLSHGVIISLREPTARDYIVSNQKNTRGDTTEDNTVITVQELGEDRVEKLFTRLPALTQDPNDEIELHMRDASLKPPKTRAGKEIQLVFPPETPVALPQEVREEIAQENAKVLEVLRFAPEGVLDRLAPNISVTFSQPMVAVTSIDELSKVDVPVVVTPAPQGGRWRWVGTKTLMYEPAQDSRLNFATEYTVLVPKGTKSSTGGILAKDVKFTFSTPPPSMTQCYPYGFHHMPSNLIGFVQFDQRVNPEEVLPTLRINGKSAPNSTLLTHEQVKERLAANLEEARLFSHYHRNLQYYLLNAIPEQHFFFALGDEYDLGSKVTIEFKGVPSAEGPRRQIKSLKYEFHTYGEFRIVPSPNQMDMAPYTPVVVNFSNAIDEQSFELDKYVTLSPEVPFKVEVYGSAVTIHAQTIAKTKYTVTFSDEMRDVYGQTLAGTRSESFRTVAARESIQALQPPQFVWDRTLRGDEPSLDFVTVNLAKYKLTMYQVTLEEADWFSNYTGHLSYYTITQFKDFKDRFAKLKKVGEELVNVPLQDGSPVITSTKLTKYLQSPEDKVGQLLIHTETIKSDPHTAQHFLSWVQCTKLAVDVFAEREKTYVWVNSLEDGKPLSDVQVAQGSNSFLTVRNDGVAVLSGTTYKVAARRGTDVCLMRVQPHYSNDERSRVLVFDDRGLYKPNECVNFKGYYRDIQRSGDHGEIKALVVKPDLLLNWEVRDSRGIAYGKGSVKCNEWGSFHVTIDAIPDNVNLGDHTVYVSTNAFTHVHTFKVQEFRTPEYDVTARVAPLKYVVGSCAIARASAQYYSGGGLNQAEAKWLVSQTNSSYTPPNQGRFSFASSSPYWWHFDDTFEESNAEVKEYTGKTDSSGEHELCIDFQESQRQSKVPVTVRAECVVQDINRQAISASTSFIVHPCELYVGIQLKKTFVPQGGSILLNAVVCDIDGIEKRGTPVKFTIEKTVRVRKGTVFVSKKVVTHEEYVEFTDADKELSFQMEEGGSYTISALVEDTQGRTNSTKAFFAVSGDTDTTFKKSIQVALQEVTLIANQTTYAPGDVAKILVQSPFGAADEGIFFVVCDGVAYRERFTLDSSGCKVLSVEIKKEYVPNICVYAYIIGTDDRIAPDGTRITDESIPKRPAHAWGSLSLLIPPLVYKLQVEANVDANIVKPGSEVGAQVRVLDPSGAPVSNAEVCLVCVDEAVLSLTGYHISDPIQLISQYSASLSVSSLRSQVSMKELSQVQFEKEWEIMKRRSRMMKKNARTKGEVLCFSMASECEAMVACVDEYEEEGGDDEDYSGAEPETADDSSPITERSDFRPIACFLPELVTDSEGIIRTTISLPQNLTRFRVTAVVVSGESMFGLADTTVTTQLPLSLRPSLPRFMNFGDKNVELAVVLQNQTSTSQNVEVAVRMTNIELSNKKCGYLVSLPAGKRTELRFPVETVKPGTARFQIGAATTGGTESFADATTSTIPVYTPATSEAFATYGEIDEGGICQPVKAPGNVYPQFGGLDIQTSSTAIASLADCFLYLYNYEFSCSEQTASRILSIVAVGEILQAFNVPACPTPAAVKQNLQASFKHLQELQRSSGAFGFWAESREDSLFATNHVAHALVHAKNDGHEVPLQVFQKVMRYVANMRTNSKRSGYSKACRLALRAFAAYTLSLLKDKSTVNGVSNDSILKEAEDIYTEGSGVKKDTLLSAESLAWLASAIFVSASNGANNKTVKEIMHFINNRVNETAETANFVSGYSDAGESKMVLLHSNTRTDAVVVDTLMTVDPKNKLIPKFVKGLQAHKNAQNRWRNTQENIFVLLALKKYFNMFESKVPDFTARVWLDETFCGEATFKGRSADTQTMTVPMASIVQDSDAMVDVGEDTKDLVLHKEGPGRLYYRLGMNYAPRDLNLPAFSSGFTVSRTYEGVTSSNHVKRDTNTGEWIFAAGELVRVRITLSNQSRRYHVAMVDKLPAGLEVLNPELKGSGSAAETGGSGSCWWWRNWFDHQNLRTERVEAFTSLLWEGAHEYTYVCRATSLGSFVAPPCKVEEMYAPELFGRSAVDKVRIEYEK